MANQPIGITFLPTADAQANGPRQAGIEGQGGSDLAQAFKILSLHLPRVLGASAIAPKRLLTSPGSAGVAGPSGSSPSAQVFQALLQSMTGGMSGGYGPSDYGSLSSLFGSPMSQGSQAPSSDGAGALPPGLTYVTEPGSVGVGGQLPAPPASTSDSGYNYQPPDEQSTQYL